MDYIRNLWLTFVGCLVCYICHNNLITIWNIHWLLIIPVLYIIAIAILMVCIGIGNIINLIRGK